MISDQLLNLQSHFFDKRIKNRFLKNVDTNNKLFLSHHVYLVLLPAI